MGLPGMAGSLKDRSHLQAFEVPPARVLRQYVLTLIEYRYWHHGV